MNQCQVDALVRAKLYDPALKGAPKEKLPVVGRVWPENSCRKSGESLHTQRTECLVEGFTSATMDVTVRFLQPVARDVGRLNSPRWRWPGDTSFDFFYMVPTLNVGGETYGSGQECREHTIAIRPTNLDEMLERPRRTEFTFPATHEFEPVTNARGAVVGVVVRDRPKLTGYVELSAEPVELAATKVSILLVSTTRAPDPSDEVGICSRTFLAAHTLLRISGGEFVSLIDPPEAHAQAAAFCRNSGTWPVLLGNAQRRERGAMLSSPVVLDDYPARKSETNSPPHRASEDEVLALAPGNEFG